MNETHKTSIIMVTYHTGDILWQAINAALNKVGLDNLIIINNDNPVEVNKKLNDLAAENKKIHLININKNIGFAKACNIGAEFALQQDPEQYLLFLNPDCVINENIFNNIITQLEKNADYYMASINIKNSDNSPNAGCYRNLLTPMTALSEIFKLYKISPKFFPRLNISPPHIDPPLADNNLAVDNNAEAKGDNNITEVKAISGAFMFIKAKLFQEIGMFDERFFLHVEDLDLCKKISCYKKKIIFINSTQAIHHKSSSNSSKIFIEWQKT